MIMVSLIFMAIGLTITTIVLTIIIIQQKRNLRSYKCDNCQNQHSMDCPNSSECYCLNYKPYFKKKGDVNQ